MNIKRLTVLSILMGVTLSAFAEDYVPVKSPLARYIGKELMDLIQDLGMPIKMQEQGDRVVYGMTKCGEIQNKIQPWTTHGLMYRECAVHAIVVKSGIIQNVVTDKTIEKIDAY